MVSLLEKRYLSSAGLSPLRFIASLKMSGKTITYSGYCHPLSPRQFDSGRTWGYLLKERERERKKEEVPMILSKNSPKEELNNMTQKHFRKCESISLSSLNICDSIISEFDQVPTSCEPLFGSATQVIKVCHTLPTHNSRYQP